MWKFIAAAVVIVAVAVVGFSLINVSGGDISASARFTLPQADTSSFARADAPWNWQFPRDHGAHEDFQTEWWYFTGNLATEGGRRFGYQFTLFRRAIQTGPTPQGSEWRSNQVYLVHFTVSDIARETFYHDERYSRGGAALAGVQPNDREPDAPFRAWLEDWTVYAEDPGTNALRITAASPQPQFRVDLRLEPLKPPALHGDAGLSLKGGAENASYYYSLTRSLTEGVISVDGETFQVSGLTWMDHEFSTSALGPNALGWDWFGLQFDDGRDLMVGQIRLAEGGREPAFGGLLVEQDGSTRYLYASEFEIQALDRWTSPHTEALYPSGWTITLQDPELAFTVTPLLRDQELHSGDIAYWEGAVSLAGAVTGYGYAELTGYITAFPWRF